jgi:hypothetical protein
MATHISPPPLLYSKWKHSYFNNVISISVSISVLAMLIGNVLESVMKDFDSFGMSSCVVRHP